MLNKDLRRRIIEQGFKHKHGHYGSSMSCVDTIKYLYDNVMNEEDTFIMSKGHGAPALHVVSESRGLKPRWTIHLEYDPESGVEATGGSLGNGLSIALGRAFAKKLKCENKPKYFHRETDNNDNYRCRIGLNKPGKVYCMLGDGEMQEGIIWESLNIAKRLNVDNLIPMVDWNKYQAIDSIKEVMGEDYTTLKNKLTAFGYNVTKIEGHTEKGLEKLLYLKDGLQAVVMDTIKGYGIPFLEANPTHHVLYMHEKPEVMQEALEHLK